MNIDITNDEEFIELLRQLQQQNQRTFKFIKNGREVLWIEVKYLNI